MILEYEGYEVSEACDGQDALDQLSTRTRPCLILLDLMMPKMNGWEFAEKIEKNHFLSTIPVIIFTAFAERAGKLAATHRVLKKPIGIEFLLEVAQEYCGPPTESEKSPIRAAG